MKVVILAVGTGTSISEESYLKFMIEIGEKPILWHLMKIFDAQTFNDFIICVGGWINDDLFVLKPKGFDYLPEHSNSLMREDYPLKKTSRDNQLIAYRHSGFWQCMDATHDKEILEQPILCRCQLPS